MCVLISSQQASKVSCLWFQAGDCLPARAHALTHRTLDISAPLHRVLYNRVAVMCARLAWTRGDADAATPTRVMLGMSTTRGQPSDGSLCSCRVYALTVCRLLGEQTKYVLWNILLKEQNVKTSLVRLNRF